MKSLRELLDTKFAIFDETRVFKADSRIWSTFLQIIYGGINPREGGSMAASTVVRDGPRIFLACFA